MEIYVQMYIFTSSSQQLVNIFENDNFGNINFSDICEDLLRDEEVILQEQLVHLESVLIHLC